MSTRLARPALLALALLVPATQVGAHTHHHATTTHAKTRHATTRPATRHKSGKAAHDRRTTHAHETPRAKTAERHAAAPGGATSVPGAGLKLFCAAGRNPLLIRKATQGAGTTVTVVCR